jgi:hypothetical protein
MADQDTVVSRGQRAAHLAPAYGEPTLIVIAQLQASSTQLTAKDSVFFDEIGQRLVLPMIQPAGERGEQNSQRGHIDHGGRVYLIDRDSVSRNRGADLWDTTGSAGATGHHSHL